MELDTGFAKDLEAPLTDEEVEQRATNLARLLEDIAKTETEAKTVASQYSQKLKKDHTRAMDLAHAVSRRKENRPVLCSERADFRRFTIETYRHDNGAVVDTRPMEPDELDEAKQGHLFGHTRVADDSTKPAKEKRKKGLDLTGSQGEEADADPPRAANWQQVHEAISVLKDPDGTGQTQVTHGFVGEEMKPVGRVTDPTPEDDGEPSITDPGAVLEGRSTPAASLATGFASAQAAQNEVTVRKDDEEFDQPLGDDDGG